MAICQNVCTDITLQISNNLFTATFNYNRESLKLRRLKHNTLQYTSFYLLYNPCLNQILLKRKGLGVGIAPHSPLQVDSLT